MSEGLLIFNKDDPNDRWGLETLERIEHEKRDAPWSRKHLTGEDYRRIHQEVLNHPFNRNHDVVRNRNGDVVLDENGSPRRYIRESELYHYNPNPSNLRPALEEIQRVRERDRRNAEEWRLRQDVVGYPAARFQDAGYFYCPYIPLTQSPTISLDDIQNYRSKRIQPEPIEEVDWVKEGF